MNLKQCEGFLKLAETGSFMKAYQELFITKQGLSRTIHALEAELGATLFQRTTHGTELSESGEAILPEMKNIWREYQQMTKKLRGGPDNELKIIFSFGFFLCISPEIIFHYLEHNPTLRFQYACYCDSEIEGELLSSDFDLAFCSNKERREQLEYVHLFKNYRCLAVHRDLPLAKKQFITVNDLDGLKIAVSAPERYNDYAYLCQKFAQEGKTPNIFPCYESSTLISFAEEKRGVSLIITNLNRSRPSEDTCYVFFDDYETSSYDVNIITKARGKRSRQADEFIRHAQEYCQNALMRRPGFPLD